MPERQEITTYEQAVAYVLGIPRFTKKNTMEDTRAFLHRLGDPDREMKIIHVAGTNGKGSVCAYLYAILREAGYRCSLFTSPHLVDVRERFSCDGSMVTKEEFLNAFRQVYDAIPFPGEEGYHPTFFEYLFFMAMLLFREKKTEYCILETGLGGRLDATNSVAKKELAVITHMGLDHTEYLGNTLEAIAGEKAGIMQAGAPAVFWETDEGVSQVLKKSAEKLRISAFPVSKSDYGFLKNSNKGIDFSYRSLYYDSIRFHINTIASYQMENVTLAVRAAEVLMGGKLSPEMLCRGLEKAFWAGRMEEILPDIYVDGAHNEDGIRAFLETVAQDGCSGGRRLVFGVVADKAYDDMIAEIADSHLFDEVWAVQLAGSRALPVATIAETFRKHMTKSVLIFESVKDAYKALTEGKREGRRSYIAGSLYLVGEIKELL